MTAAEAVVKTEHNRKWKATQKAKLQLCLSAVCNSLASRRAYSRYSELLFLKLRYIVII